MICCDPVLFWSRLFLDTNPATIHHQQYYDTAKVMDYIEKRLLQAYRNERVKRWYGD